MERSGEREKERKKKNYMSANDGKERYGELHNVMLSMLDQ